MAKRRKPKPRIETYVTTINGLTWHTVRTTYEPAQVRQVQTTDGTIVRVARFGTTDSLLIDP